MKILTAAICALLMACRLSAADSLHRIELKTCAAFEVVAPNGVDSFSVYPLSEGVRKVAQGGSRKTLEAADYAVGVKISTKNPQMALQEIVRQIYVSTGRPLGKFMNGSLALMAPSSMLIAADADSVWCLVLTPTGKQDTFLLACGYVIDAKKEANQAPQPTAPSGRG